jgi:predicted enzyme related to lactoylglutathione lyase
MMMYKVEKYPHGTFSWADNSSTDQETSKKFYANVMGWGVDDMPLGDDQFYTMFQLDGRYAAGLGPMQSDMLAQGIPSHWTSYVTVEDVDAMVEKVNELGGTIIAEPFDIYDSGRMMVLQDPEGATVAMWQPKDHIGAGVVNKPGALCWNELYVRDTEKARDFYGKLFNWTFQKIEDMEYYTIWNNGRGNGGIMQITDEWGEMPANWTVYFSVEDIERTVEAIKANGGTVHGEILDASDVGRFVMAADPSGATAAYIQLENPETWTA